MKFVALLLLTALVVIALSEARRHHRGKKIKIGGHRGHPCKKYGKRGLKKPCPRVKKPVKPIRKPDKPIRKPDKPIRKPDKPIRKPDKIIDDRHDGILSRIGDELVPLLGNAAGSLLDHGLNALFRGEEQYGQGEEYYEYQ